MAYTLMKPGPPARTSNAPFTCKGVQMSSTPLPVLVSDFADAKTTLPEMAPAPSTATSGNVIVGAAVVSNVVAII